MKILQYNGMDELYVKSLDGWNTFSSSKYFVDVMSSMSFTDPSVLPQTSVGDDIAVNWTFEIESGSRIECMC